MAQDLLSEDQARAALSKHIGKRSQRAVAAELAVSEPFLSQALSGKKRLGLIAPQIGLEKVICYRKIACNAEKRSA